MAGHSAPMPRETGKALDAWLRGLAPSVRPTIATVVGLGVAGGLLSSSRRPGSWRAWSMPSSSPAAVRGPFGIGCGCSSRSSPSRAVVAAVGEAFAFEAGARIVIEVRERLQAHVVALGPAWIRGERTGDLVNTMVDGVEAMHRYYAAYLPQMTLSACIPVAILAFVLPADWISGLIMVLSAPLIPLFMILIGKGTEAMNQSQWRKLARMSAHFFDMIEGLTTLKLFNASRREIAVVAAISDDYRRSTMAVLRVAFLSSLALEFFATVSIAMVAVFIGFRLYYREMDFFAGFFVLLLAPEFYRPLRAMGTQYHARMEAIGASEAIVALLQTPLPRSGTGRRTLPGATIGAVRFADVGFAYGGEPALRDIAFTLARGERVALVGPSGAGKTTVSQLLLGFLAPANGRILVDGIDLGEVAREDWMRRVAWLPQRPTLFQGSVLDNIRLARADADIMDTDMDAVRRAVAQAGASELIAGLPRGYDTMLGDRGQGLSGGEIQRIALARLFLKEADIVVIDEPSAGLDEATAALITASIERLSPRCAMLIIAHRLETIRRADTILVLDKGRIVERGRHGDLLAQDGLYARLAGVPQGVPA